MYLEMSVWFPVVLITISAWNRPLNQIKSNIYKCNCLVSRNLNDCPKKKKHWHTPVSTKNVSTKKNRCWCICLDCLNLLTGQPSLKIWTQSQHFYTSKKSQLPELLRLYRWTAIWEATNFFVKSWSAFFFLFLFLKEHFIRGITFCLALLTAVFWSPWLLFDAAFPLPQCVCAMWFRCVFWPPADTI